MKPRLELDAAGALVRLDGAWYGPEAVKAGAAALAGRARLRVSRGRAGAAVAIEPIGGADAFALAGDFLDAALDHALRAETVAAGRAHTAPVLARVYETAFTAVPKDPLEEMDPAVAGRRAAETAALLKEAA